MYSINAMQTGQEPYYLNHSRNTIFCAANAPAHGWGKARSNSD